MVSFANWSVLTVDFLIVLYLMLGGVTFISILHLSNAKWRYQVRTVLVSLFGLYPVAFVLLVVLLVAGKMTFPWLDLAEGQGEHHLPGWHNYTFLVMRQVGALIFVGWIFSRFIKLQAVSEQSAENWERFKRTALLIPFVYVLYGTMVAWDFEMTILPSWHSAIYGMYHFVSNFGMFLAFTVALIYFLDKNGKLVKPMPSHIYNYFAQMMLSFTILWIYLFFAQYLTIWYGNLPYERDRIVGMESGDYAGLWWTFFILKFIIPFVLLVFSYTRHNPSLIVKIAFSIMIGTWIERYTWISGAYNNSHLPMTDLFDIVVTALVVIAAYVMVKRSLTRDDVIHN